VSTLNLTRRRFIIGALVMLLFVGSSDALPGGIYGDQATGENDVAKTGCTCHSGNEVVPDDSVTLLVTDVPFLYVAGNEYPMKIQIIGGPAVHSEGSDATGGFSLRVSDGALGPGEGYESMVSNGGSNADDTYTLTHTSDGKNPSDRSWLFTWTAPTTGSGDVTFWLSGNSVNGNGLNTGDAWNRLAFPIGEGGNLTATHTISAGNGESVEISTDDGHLDLHDMGAKFRAHWLGLLGFGAVILVILFCGFFLRYGFSRHYEGRSNLLRNRIKHLRRGDQL